MSTYPVFYVTPSELGDLWSASKSFFLQKSVYSRSWLFKDRSQFLSEIKKIAPNRKSEISLSSMRVGGSYSQESKYSGVLSNDQIWVPNSFSASRFSICSFLPSAETSLRKWLRSLKSQLLAYTDSGNNKKTFFLPGKDLRAQTELHKKLDM